MLEDEGAVGDHSLEIARQELCGQDAVGVAVGDKLVVEGPAGMAQGHEPFGIGELLQQDVVDSRQPVLKVPECANVRTDPFADA